MILGELVFPKAEYNMEGSTHGQGIGTLLPAVLTDDAKKQPCEQQPLVKLKCVTEVFTIENSTCCMNNVAHFMMTGWSTVLIAIETSTDSSMYVAALIFNLFTWVVAVIMIIMIVIRRRVCAGKVLRLVDEEWPEETMNKAKMLQRISSRLSMTLVVLHTISMVVTSVHISGIVDNKPSSAYALNMGSDPDGKHLANSTSDA